ncbi:MAG: glycosyltransferase family 39 protein [bacterium]
MNKQALVYGFFRKHLLLVVILILFSILSLLYSWCTPIFEYPDEQGHFSVVQHIAERGSLPVLSESSWLHEGYNPPLYYLLLVPLYRLVGQDVDIQVNPSWGHGNPQVYLHDEAAESKYKMMFQILRLPNFVLSLLLLLVLYYTGLLLWEKQVYALAGMGFVAFIPQFTWLSGSIGSDIFYALLSAVLLYCLLAVLRKGRVSFRMSMIIGITLGLGLLLKYQMLLFLPIILLVFIIRPKANRFLVLSLFLAFVLAGWFYLRNFQLYGEIIPWTLYKGVYSSLLGSNNQPLSPMYWLFYIISLFLTFWGEFDHGYFFLPAFLYAGYLFMTCILGVGVFLGRKSITRTDSLVYGSVFLLTNGLVFFYGLRFSVILQGRFLFPALGCFSWLAVAGLQLWEQRGKWILPLLGCVYLGMNIICFVVLFLGERVST